MRTVFKPLFNVECFCHSISKVIAVVRDTSLSESFDPSRVGMHFQQRGISGARNESKVQLHTVKFHSRIIYLWQTGTLVDGQHRYNDINIQI